LFSYQKLFNDLDFTSCPVGSQVALFLEAFNIQEFTMKNNIFLTGMVKFSGLVGTFETNVSLTNCNVTESLFFTTLNYASIITVSTSTLKIWNCTIRILHTNSSTQSVGLVNYAQIL
jgi:hypothetical protein